MVTINQLGDIAGKKLTKKHIPGTLGVRGRNSDLPGEPVAEPLFLAVGTLLPRQESDSSI